MQLGVFIEMEERRWLRVAGSGWCQEWGGKNVKDNGTRGANREIASKTR